MTLYLFRVNGRNQSVSVITLYNVLFFMVKMSQNGTGLFCTIKDKIRMRGPEMVQNNPVPF